MRRFTLILWAALAAPVAAGAQSLESKDWQVVCDNTRACRAAGYSVEGSDMPVSVMLARASGPGMPLVGELQLGTLGAGAVRPGSVFLTIAGKPAGPIRLDRDNHAALSQPVIAALLRAVVGGTDVSFTAGKSAWRLSASGAVDVLSQIDDVQGRAGRTSAIVRRGNGSDGDVASAMAMPRLQGVFIPTAAQPDDRALAVRVLASIQSSPSCPLLDDGNAQAKARLWHIDANRLLVTQPCQAPASNVGNNGYWLANLRPPYDAKPMTTSGGDYDGSGTIVARRLDGPAGDCGTIEAWTWNGYRFEQTFAATGGLCRGVKAGGAWQLPSVVTDVVQGN
ncbi:DUF1176 domain-containing protein [Scleromatobacter humisilvae]|uniref:DUF1176 domain-containing protein n=1 Tax=Scleromatobacter humisilvae TaxID=2897159 RepID=A0A9X2C1Q5_9BURK|nr:DUF1176 domain-containing protein [Scleromatobacter humisilvae]MCK9686029.1 DUF1176 domain-containing protein [Scleromatobacter humisilvae]